RERVGALLSSESAKVQGRWKNIRGWRQPDLHFDLCIIQNADALAAMHGPFAVPFTFAHGSTHKGEKLEPREIAKQGQRRREGVEGGGGEHERLEVGERARPGHATARDEYISAGHALGTHRDGDIAEIGLFASKRCFRRGRRGRLDKERMALSVR